jgi:hypothetical protein
MVELPQDKYTEIGLELDRDKDYYFAEISKLRGDSRFPIFSEEGINFTAEALATKRCNSILLAQSDIQSEDWRYHSVNRTDSLLCEALYCPPAGLQHTKLPPTAGEFLLINCWLSDTITSNDHYGGAMLCRMGEAVDGLAQNDLLSLVGCRLRAPVITGNVSYLDGKSNINLNDDSR